MKAIQTAALVVIAMCYLANTIDVYTAEDGGHNYFFGNFGYHVEEENP